MNVDSSMCASSAKAVHPDSSTDLSVNANARRLQVRIVKATRPRRETGSDHTGLCGCLSRMRRKSHVRF
jgi:hypothetical protein